LSHYHIPNLRFCCSARPKAHHYTYLNCEYTVVNEIMSSTEEGTPAAPFTENITNLLQAARILAGKQKEDNNAGSNKNQLQDVLQTRLKALQELKLGPLNSTVTNIDQGVGPDSNLDVKTVEYQTGSFALALLQLLQAAEIERLEESKESHFSFSELPVRDQASIRTLASLVFRWKLSREVEALNTSKSTNPRRALHLQVVNQSTMVLLQMMFPPSTSASTSNVSLDISPEKQDRQDQRGSQSTAIRTILLHSHALDILPAGFSLGWLPPGQCQDGSYIRASTLQILSR
jgi:hypothetical protein